MPHVDHFIAVSEYTRSSWRSTSGFTPSASAWCVGHQHRWPRARCATDCAAVHDWLLARIARRRACTCCAMPTIGFATGPMSRDAAGGGGYLLEEHREYLSGCSDACATGDMRALYVCWFADRDGKIALLRRSMSSLPRRTRIPRGCSCSKQWRTACRGQPRHGAFPEIIARTGGGVLVTPEETTRGRSASLAPRSRCAAELGAAGAAGFEPLQRGSMRHRPSRCSVHVVARISPRSTTRPAAGPHPR